MVRARAMEAPLPRAFREAMELRRRSKGGERVSKAEMVSLLRRTWSMAEANALFSIHEELDDVATKDIKYFLLPYYLAESLQEMEGADRRGRKDDLRDSLRAIEEFLSLCRSYDVRGVEAVDGEGEGEAQLDPQTARQRKIEHFKREKRIRERLEFVESRKKAVARISDEDNEDDDEDERELWLLQLEDAVIQAVRMKRMHQQELEVLEFAENLPERNEMQADAGQPEVPAVIPLHARTSRARKEVFRPSHRLPIMSVEEYGERLRKEMLEREEAPMAAPSKGDAQELDSEDEESCRKARDWDDWKDEHRRGEGNSRLRPCGR
mmetsp:Transcript_899/g.3487  ORF Transcript_899/g.3487 Transcript_899/m.3487 type:complete len:323 (-) Transcript_899:1105-2073(-)